jgi:hypothetical protein
MKYHDISVILHVSRISQIHKSHEIHIYLYVRSHMISHDFFHVIYHEIFPKGIFRINGLVQL